MVICNANATNMTEFYVLNQNEATILNKIFDEQIILNKHGHASSLYVYTRYKL